MAFHRMGFHWKSLRKNYLFGSKVVFQFAVLACVLALVVLQ